MSYHHRLTKIVTKKSQLAKEELALEKERKDLFGVMTPEEKSSVSHIFKENL